MEMNVASIILRIPYYPGSSNLIGESPTFPRTRSYPRAYSSDAVCSTSTDRKPASARKVLGKDFSGATGDDSVLSSKRQKMDLGKNRQDEKTKPEPLARVVNRSQTKRGRASELSLLQDDPDDTAGKKTATTQRSETDAKKEPTYEYKTIRPKSNEMSAENNLRIHSMSELAAYKKQYYDTLLSVQRAKVAVTNSLASFSTASSSSLSLDRLTAYDDPYYANYMCQQQHLFQQQRQFAAIRPQFSPTCSAALSGLTSAQQQQQRGGNQQYSWARSDCKYLLFKQLRLRRQVRGATLRHDTGKNFYI
ncbi:hypothetical protein EAI_11649 [Harpegnathos saltator]|uniref:Uncharacterized protein n=1 Tax=Harpegnathos saltator TaxID=610380 RepID=E2BQR8_HARSA|nr:hypothetical protein EAI_11649 [Harpegnathos saltator]